ncbi:MAG TPA: N-acetylmuramoyl-L-alanine amidase [Longimicrobiaceae bacterium]|nr:N-acetylmuramoyl-L-alanine amidase [Longimicrobiaceae bacterium]
MAGRSSLRRRLLPALLLALAPLLPHDASAQKPPAWSVEGGPHGVAVAPAVGRGYAALPLSALVAVGAELAPGPEEVAVRLGGRELRFRPGSPVFTDGGEVRRLANPVYVEDGVTWVPTEFFVEHLPALGVEVDAARRVIRRVRTAANVPAPERDEAAPAPDEPRTDAAPRRAPPPAPVKKLVVVDAGHGGVDPGARGPGGTREKTVALAVARRLAEILRRDPQYEVRMTRDRDTLIALRDRARLANGWRREGQPALFMSIHLNANPSRSARGFETYFLSEAKTADAKRVEEMENAAQQYEDDAGKRDPLSFILHDLRQNKYLRDSNDWAALIQDELEAVHPGPNRGVKQAGFYVLNGAFMPAVLVEIGFISNPQEEQLLASARQQQLIAERLARSVHAFFGREGARASADR